VRTHHAFLSGLVGGLILDKETFVVLVIGAAIGAAAVLAWAAAGRIAQWARRQFGKLPASPYDHSGKPW
jgi:hypothetical protein